MCLPFRSGIDTKSKTDTICLDAHFKPANSSSNIVDSIILFIVIAFLERVLVVIVALHPAWCRGVSIVVLVSGSGESSNHWPVPA